MLPALANKEFRMSRLMETPFLLPVFRTLNHWEPKHHPNSFCICDYQKFIFLNLYFYTTSKKHVGEGVKRICFKKEIWLKWNQRNLFSEDFFWMSVVAKEYEHNCMSCKFPWRLDGVKPKVQSVGIRECCIFMSLSFFVRKVSYN